MINTVVISLSGVLAPGPITAATLAAGAERRHAGALVALGHLVVEGPLILLLVAGIGAFLQTEGVRAGIGLAGGGFLLLMGVQLGMNLRGLEMGASAAVQRHPFWTGIVLTGANPYFLLWWATIGLALAVQAAELGPLALALFATVHWLCDLGWLEVLSLAGHKGSEAMGVKRQRIVLAFCAVVLLGFGVKFIIDASVSIVR